MKVIATVEYHKYICQVDHRELEKFMNLYYTRDDKLIDLKVGDEIDLSKGFDHASEIKSALNESKKFIEASSKIVAAITTGIALCNTEDS